MMARTTPDLDKVKESAAGARTARQTPPQLKFQCTNGSCDEVGKEKVADAGVVVGDKVMIIGTHSCMTCGGSLLPLGTAEKRASKATDE